MRGIYVLALILGLLIAGCVQPPPPTGNNTTNGTTGNNSTFIPPGYEVKDYCEKDSDCVRLNKCCDCGLGEYVNKYNQQPECPPGQPRCMCAIALSEGKCDGNVCIAVGVPVQGASLTFHGGQGQCGDEVAPQRTDTDDTIMFSGAVGNGSVCRTVSGVLFEANGSYVLDITTRAETGIDTCINCLGAIPWEANITGYNGEVKVYYDGRKVYPETAGFCGWSTNGTCASDEDCVVGGCSEQVCQSINETPVITTCIYAACYNAQAYNLSCNCVSKKCMWQ